MHHGFTWTAAILVAAASAPAIAATLADEVRALDDGWAQVAFGTQAPAGKAASLERLARVAAGIAARHPDRAEPLLWQGILAGEQANFVSIFRKMGYARQTRGFLQRAYALDPAAANGGVALGLGVLYYKVPGSPIGFGNRDRARRFLREALALDPDGLETNYFQADFLHAQGDRAGARAHLQRALRAPRDTARPLWDAGRRREVRALLARIPA